MQPGTTARHAVSIVASSDPPEPFRHIAPPPSIRQRSAAGHAIERKNDRMMAGAAGMNVKRTRLRAA
jgi:hypothetical protein